MLQLGFQATARYAFDHGSRLHDSVDVDGQHCPEYLSAFGEQAEAFDSDIVIGSRFMTVRKDISMRIVGSRMIIVLII